MLKATGVVQGEQWVRIVIIGQSFMLHQIRKMVGMALAIMRGDAPPNCIKVALQPKRSVPTPMAPEIGLFLDECYYEAYNTRFVGTRSMQLLCVSLLNAAAVCVPECLQQVSSIWEISTLRQRCPTA